MQGQVVHARLGQRQHYQPITSSLCATSQPLEVVQAFLELYPFNTIYIADLDAIQGIGNHQQCVNSLANTFPSVQFWLDAGIRDQAPLPSAYESNVRLIIGSENMLDIATYESIDNALHHQFILSLDRKGPELLGPAELHDTPDHWPEAVIAMQLSQVGSGLGVNITLIEQITAYNQLRNEPSRIYAAGGVRHLQDCQQLRKKGVSGVLVATALHNGSVSRQDLNKFYNQ